MIMRPDVARSVLPWFVPVAAAASIVAALFLQTHVAAERAETADLYLADAWASLLYPAVGSWFISRGGNRRVGGLMLLAGCLALAALSAAFADLDALDGGLSVAGSVAAWVAAWAWTPYLLLPTVLPLLYPDGEPRSLGRRLVAVTALATVALIAVTSAVAPVRLNEATTLHNPAGVSSFSVLADLAATLPTIVMLGLLPLTFAVLAVERARRPRPGSTAGLVGCAAFLIAVLVFGDLAYPWGDVVTAAGLSVLPLAVVVDTHARLVRDEERAELQRLRAAREEERRRVRQELHDGVAPELAGLSLQVEALTLDAEGEQRAALHQASQRLRDSAVEVRRIVDGLGPTVVDQLGLAGALQAHADRVSGGTATVLAGRLPDLPAASELAAYRIGCEAVTNAARHAEGAAIKVELRCERGHLRLTVTDDGPGGAACRPGGLGIPGMVSRAEAAGGRCRVRNADPTGTIVEVELPLANAQDETP